MGMNDTLMTGGENVGPGGPYWGQPLPSQEASLAKVEEVFGQEQRCREEANLQGKYTYPSFGDFN